MVIRRKLRSACGVRVEIVLLTARGLEINVAQLFCARVHIIT